MSRNCTFSERNQEPYRFRCDDLEIKHRLFAELCFAGASSVPIADEWKALAEAGNCICMGLSKAFPALTDDILQYAQKDCGENRDAKHFERSYKTTFEALKIQAVPTLGLQSGIWW